MGYDRKITGKGQTNSIKHTVKDGENITDVKHISNTIAETISTISSSVNCSETFQGHKLQHERIPLDFNSDNIEDYHLPFTIKELIDSLERPMMHQWDQIDIHYQLLKHLPDISRNALIDLFNDICDDGVFLQVGETLPSSPYINQTKTILTPQITDLLP